MHPHAKNIRPAIESLFVRRCDDRDAGESGGEFLQRAQAVAQEFHIFSMDDIHYFYASTPR